MTDRRKAPSINPFLSIQLPEPVLETLDNSISFYQFPNETLELIHLQVDIRSGAMYEPKKHLALFTYGLLKGCHPRHQAAEMADLLDFYGSTFDVDIYLDSVSIKIVIPKRNIKPLLPEIIEMMTSPVYRQDYLDLIRLQRVQSLRNNLKKNSFIASRQMLRAMLGDQCAAGQPASEDSFAAITISDLTSYHAVNFCAENIALYATGSLDQATNELIRRSFEKIGHGVKQSELPLFQMPADKSPLLNFHVADSVQSSLCIAMPRLSYTEEVCSPFKILSTITGGYFGSRLMQRVREKLGYTYGIYCSSTYFGRQSIFNIQSDVDLHHTQEAVDACFDELEKLRREPVSDDELQTVKTYMTGSIIQELSTSVAMMSKFAFWKVQHADQHLLQRMLDVIQETRAEEIKIMAEDIFKHNNFAQIIVGIKL